MTRYRIASQVLITSLSLILIVSVGMSVFYSQAISSIKLTALDQAQEPRDARVIGIGEDHLLPDYRIEIRDRNDKAFDLGMLPNQSALAGLTWECNETIPFGTAATLRLVEVDLLKPDVVEELTISAQTIKSDNYIYQLELQRSFRVGTIFFLFSTPVGWILMGLFVVVGVALASNICVAS